MKYAVPSCLIILCLPLAAFAQEDASSRPAIDLEKSFWSGWKFSTDGENFEKVGVSGTALRAAMEGNAAAQAKMDAYRTSNVTAVIAASAGAFFIGWPLGASLAQSEWKDEHTTMLIIGSGLTAVGVIFGASATRQLQDAVEIYNGEDVSLRLGLPPPSATGMSAGAALSIRY
jgi:hypothetical protein